MSINKESDIAANLQIGPTDQGMVRIYVEAQSAQEVQALLSEAVKRVQAFDPASAH